MSIPWLLMPWRLKKPGHQEVRYWPNKAKYFVCSITRVNTLRPRQNGRHFADNIFNCIFLNENVWMPIKISLKFVPKSPINNIPDLIQIMAWCHPGNKPLSESMMVSLPTHICVTRPQWVNMPMPVRHMASWTCSMIRFSTHVITISGYQIYSG